VLPGLNPPALLQAALDQIDYGIVLVDKALQVLLINRAFYRMWSLSPPLGAVCRPDAAAGTTAKGLPALRGIDAFVSRRVADVREGRQAALEMWLAGGRILKLECIELPDGDSMVTYSNVSDLVHTGEKLRELASIDDLTKLLNRRQFLASLDDEFTRALRFGLPLSVAIIDVDHFKQVNAAMAIPSATSSCALSPSAAAASSGGTIFWGAWAARSSRPPSSRPTCARRSRPRNGSARKSPPSPSTSGMPSSPLR
jgi:PAS fold/Diguanylate cyclase, GGDEF domain